MRTIRRSVTLLLRCSECAGLEISQHWMNPWKTKKQYYNFLWVAIYMSGPAVRHATSASDSILMSKLDQLFFQSKFSASYATLQL